MPKRKRREIPTPAWERPHGAIGRQLAGRSAQFYAAVGVVLLAIAGLVFVGYGFLADYIADQNRPDSTAVRVDDTKFTLTYYTERLKTYIRQVGGTGAQLATPQIAFTAVVEQLVEETILLRFAGEEGLTASEDEIKKQIATAMGIPVDDPNYEARFQEELARSGLTEDQYRDMMEATVLRKKMVEKYTAGIPASAESIHYRGILVGTQSEADDIKQQIEDGADFAQLAAEKSLDSQTNQTGGDAGWVPRGVLSKEVEDTLFALDTNAVTTYPTGSTVWVYQLLEKQADRAVEESQKPTLAEKAYGEWLSEKRGTVKVEETVTTDADKFRWAYDRAYGTT